MKHEMQLADQFNFGEFLKVHLMLEYQRVTARSPALHISIIIIIINNTEWWAFRRPTILTGPKVTKFIAFYRSSLHNSVHGYTRQIKLTLSACEGQIQITDSLSYHQLRSCSVSKSRQAIASNVTWRFSSPRTYVDDVSSTRRWHNCSATRHITMSSSSSSSSSAAAAADHHSDSCSFYQQRLFHRFTRTAYLNNGCLPWYNVVLTSRVHSSVKYSQQSQLRSRATVE